MYNPQIQEVFSALGISMEEVAKCLHWSYEKIADYATTSKEVPDAVINILSNKLGVEPEMFLHDNYKKLTLS